MFTNMILPLAAVLLLGTGAAFAESGEKPDERPARAPYMDPYDTDKDGQISAEEAAAKAEKKFGEIDADKDGKISLDEMDKYREAEKLEREAKRAEREEAMKKKYREKIDPDGDGHVTKEEFLKNASERHTKMDADGDGKVSKGDLAKKMREHREGKHSPADKPAETKAE